MIPKDTMVFPNLGHVMSDPDHFPDPLQFDPTRHLDPSGTRFQPHPMVVPFGLGKRRCLGEALARMTLYLVFTGILHRFEVQRLDPEGPLLDETPQVFFIKIPRPYQVVFKLRE